jgi:threonine synthase
VLATNVNDILSRFFNTGVYSLGAVVQTTSPSMDIQVASNFERYLFHKLGGDSGKLNDLMNGFARTGSLSVPAGSGGVDPAFLAGAATEQQVQATIAEFWDKHHYLLDPHTAVGVSVAMRAPADRLPVICLATAHPAKFPDAIRQATGRDLARHPALDALSGRPTRFTVMPVSAPAVRDFIRAHAGGVGEKQNTEDGRQNGDGA